MNFFDNRFWNRRRPRRRRYRYHRPSLSDNGQRQALQVRNKQVVVFIKLVFSIGE